MTTYTKVCATCKIAKPTTDFNKNKRTKDGLCIQCRSCQKEYRKNNKSRIKERQKEYDKEYYQANKDQRNKHCKEYYQSNKDRAKEYQREYCRINEEQVRTRRKKYNQANKASNSTRQVNYHRKRRSIDPLFALTERIRSLIGGAFRKRGYTKMSRTREILGCSYEELMAHIESQFTEGMSWYNRDKWHVDHKMPVSWGETEEEIIALNHYTNLKPMWALDNILKSNNYEG